MLNLLRNDSSYRKLINACLGVLVASALAGSYFPSIALISEIVAAGSGLIAAFAYCVNVILPHGINDEGKRTAIVPAEATVVESRETSPETPPSLKEVVDVNMLPGTRSRFVEAKYLMMLTQHHREIADNFHEFVAQNKRDLDAVSKFYLLEKSSHNPADSAYIVYKLLQDHQTALEEAFFSAIRPTMEVSTRVKIADFHIDVRPRIKTPKSRAVIEEIGITRRVVPVH